MILPAQKIKERCLFKSKIKPMIAPFLERTRTDDGLTFGLSPAGYDVRIAEDIHLFPTYSSPAHAFALASTIEQFCMPDDVLAIVHDKSTWARRGLCVQNTVIEPGWRGYLTLELTNHSARSILIAKGAPIAQIVFHQLIEPTKQPYEGKYQDQQSGPQAAR